MLLYYYAKLNTQHGVNKMSYGVQSPSKYTSLERLEQIKKDNCVAASGKEFSELEIELMILEKKALQAEREYIDFCRSEFLRAESDEIMETAEANGDMILGRDYGVLIIEGSKPQGRTIVKAVKQARKNPYGLKNIAQSKRYGFKTRLLALQYCIRNIEAMKDCASGRETYRLERLRANKANKEAFRSKILPGVILSDSWGYEQTQVEFYRVLEVNGCSVVIQQLSEITVKGSEGRDCCRVMPGDLVGSPEKRTIGSRSIKICDSIKLTVWDGSSLYKSWYY